MSPQNNGLPLAMIKGLSIFASASIEMTPRVLGYKLDVGMKEELQVELKTIRCTFIYLRETVILIF